MDAEWDKQFDDHRKRLKEITKLILDNNHEAGNGLLDQVRSVVKASVAVRCSASKKASVIENVIGQVDACDDLEKVEIGEIYSIESEKDVAAPSLNYEAEFETYLISLKHDAEDGEIMSQASQGVSVDPWTKRPIEHPVRSKICGHVYDRASIEAIKKTKKEIKCPYIGCKVRVNVNDLEYD